MSELMNVGLCAAVVVWNLLDLFLFCGFKTPPGARGGGNAVFGTVETIDYTDNSTDTTHFVYGVTANLFAVLLYGSSFVPIKRIETGDGKNTAPHFI